MAITEFQGQNRFLSNFWACEIDAYGYTVASPEHAYVMSKTNNLDDRHLIAQIESSGQVKRFGKSITLRPDWDDALRLRIMRALTIQKYARHAYLAQRLLDTYPQEVIEGNTWHDKFFGRCHCHRCNGKGENHLGQILMDVREQLRMGPLVWTPLSI